MKKNGFTLIELLAVVVILAIIALIAVPIVLNIINNSKESSRIRSAELYLDAVNNAVARKQLDSEFNPQSCEIQSNGNLKCDGQTEEIIIEVDGEKPNNGTITFNSNKISTISLKYGTEDEIVMDENGDLIYEVVLAPGLYNAEGELLASWDELVNDYGMDVERDYAFAATNKPANIINNNFPGATKLIIGKNVSKIGNCAFSESSSLVSIEIPDSVTSIGSSAFNRCSSLTSIKIPNGVTSIGEAFYMCTSLTTVEIPGSVTSINTFTFEECPSLTTVKLGNGITSIEKSAFMNCKSLKSIEIPASVTNIEGDVFDVCDNLETIKVDENNTVYDSRDNSNAIIETATNTLIEGCKNTVIPNSVTSIGVGAFYGVLGLTEIEIPSSVTTIDEWAFEYCLNLKTIYYKGTATGAPWAAPYATVVTDY